MSRTPSVQTICAIAASLMIGLAGCSDSNDPSNDSTISATEASDIGGALADEVDQSAASLSLHGAGAIEIPPGPDCATVSNTTDTDGDGAPDDATYTFALPACRFTGFRGGSLEVTGSVDLSDPTPDHSDFSYQASLHDLQFQFTGPQEDLTFTAVRNGTRTLTGNATGASLSNDITVERTFPVRQPATVTHNLLLTFTPDAGEALAVGQPLPNGTFVKSGTFTWTRGSRTRTFVVTTVAPLVWDASCTTDRKIVSGEIHATLGGGGYLRTVWAGCGGDPARTFVPAH